MKRYPWPDAKHQLTEPGLMKPMDDLLSWWEIWDQILSGLVWLA